jgi:hypothetical protein
MVLAGGSDSHEATRFEQSRVSDPGYSQSPLTNHSGITAAGVALVSVAVPEYLSALE